MPSTTHLLAAIALLAAPLQGQPVASSPDARREAMQRLAFLVGEWSGDSRVTTGPGSTLHVRQSERVRYAVGGQLLVIEGTGRGLTDGVPGDTAFQAFGVVDWRPDRGYQLRSFTHEGREGAFPITLAEHGNAFTWGFEVPGGRVRYTVRLTPDGAWHERGEFSRDGAQWTPTMEMQLRKTTPK